MLSVRLATSADLDALRDLFARSALSVDEYREALLLHPGALELADTAVREGRTRVAVADGGRIVGFATTLAGPAGLEVQDLFVDPAATGRGIGRALVDDAAATAREHGIGWLAVTAGPGARGFYEKAGFAYDHDVETRFGPALRMHRAVAAGGGTPPSGSGELTFRRIVDADLPLLHGWLNEPGVVRWWEGDDVSWEAVARDYVRDGTAEHWIACRGGAGVGWIQCWAVADEPVECGPWIALGIDRTAAGIDYLVGDPADRGRGVGSAMIRAFVDDVVFGLHRQWSQACAAPYDANEASWRALEKAGFRFVGTVDDMEGPCRLMAADREERPTASPGGG